MAVKLEHIYKNFGDKNIFTNLCLDFEPKKTTIIMGPSGSGKTTLVNLILGLSKPDHGQIHGTRDLRIRAQFQEDRLLEHKSGLANILFVLRNPKPHIPRATELMHQAGLGPDIQKKARNYSGGMKRRLSLCRALIADSDLLILDEPFKGLDYAIKLKIMDMVAQHTGNKTLLLITHDPTEANFFDAKTIQIHS